LIQVLSKSLIKKINFYLKFLALAVTPRASVKVFQLSAGKAYPQPPEGLYALQTS